MDYENQNNIAPTIDLPHLLNQDAINTAFAQADFLLDTFSNTADEFEKMVRNVEAKLHKIIGRRYTGQWANVSGTSTIIDDMLPSSFIPFRFDNEEMVYNGPSVQVINGTLQVVLEFYEEQEIEISANDGEPTVVLHYFTRDGLEKCNIELPPELDMLDVISVEAKKDVISLDFFASSGDVQRQRLHSIAETAHGKLNILKGLIVIIEPSRYTGTYEGLPVSLMRDFIVDIDSYLERTHINAADKIWELRGAYDGISYAELDTDQHVTFKDADDFCIGNGVPCIKLIDIARMNAVYYIPTDCVNTILFADVPDHT